MSEVQLNVDNMYNGSIEAIINGISSNRPFELINAIIAGTKLDFRSEKFIEGLKRAEQNEETLLGVPIKEFAIASLDVIGVRKYIGDNDRIKEMIRCKLNF